MKPRNPAPKHRITVPGAVVMGRVSANDIAAYLYWNGWMPSGGAWFVRKPHVVPSPHNEAYRLDEAIAMIARCERRSPGETLRAIERRALGLGPIDLAPRMIEVIEEDLSALAEETRALDGFDGVRPWNRERLWREVLSPGTRAMGAEERERFLQALGVLKVLDLLDRKYVWRGE